jgi:hypothetical protein
MSRNPPRTQVAVAAVLLLPMWAPLPAPAQVTAAAPASGPDYKIAFWYRRSDPLSSMLHQVYDLRHGQYTRAVDDWLATMHRSHPDYDAYIKDLRIDPRAAESDRKQLATAILREYADRVGPSEGYGLRDALGLYGPGGLRGLIGPGVSPAPTRASHYARGYGFVDSPGASRSPSFLAPPGPASPFPYPYVRPHP